MKLELPISSTYVPNWGTFEGAREVLQNAKDAETEHDATFSVTYNDKNQCLSIKNDGSTIDRKALILGFTSKRNREDLIGEHGEGLALGILALCRSHLNVTIRLQNETWKPRLSFSEKWGEVVLCFDVRKTKSYKTPRVWIEVSGVSQMEYNELLRKIRWLPGSTSVGTEASVPGGTVLLDKDRAGDIYAKGIYIQTISGFSYGYDFKALRVDRDRGMADSWDTRYGTANAIAHAVNSGVISLDRFLYLCESGASDVEYLNYHISNIKEAAREEVAALWLEQCGDPELIPVSSVQDITDLGNWGLRGRIVTCEALRNILEQTLNRNKDEAISQASSAIVRMYTVDELHLGERLIYDRAVDLLTKANVLTGDTFKVVDFKKQDLEGMWQYGEGFFISRKILGGLSLTIRTIIHELSHERTKRNDGDRTFHCEVERLWCIFADFCLNEMP